MAGANRLQSLNLLRCIAVTLVVIYHFSDHNIQHYTSSSILSFFARYGKYGVQIFFVVSGFVIPYSFLKGNYQIGDFPIFLYKRFLRLHLPYLPALLISLLIMYWYRQSQGIPFGETTESVLWSLIYIHVPEDNVVFWTLRVEWQYYFFIGLFFPLLMRYRLAAVTAATVLLLAMYFSSLLAHVEIIRYMSYFLAGIACFLIRENTGNRVLNILVLGISIYLCYAFDYLTAAISGTFACLVVLFYEGGIPRPVAFIGTISYSIYLLHFIVGDTTINLLGKKLHWHNPWALMMVPCAVVLVVSYGFYRLFEVPCERLAGNYKYAAYGREKPMAIK